MYLLLLMQLFNTVLASRMATAQTNRFQHCEETVPRYTLTGQLEGVKVLHILSYCLVSIILNTAF